MMSQTKPQLRPTTVFSNHKELKCTLNFKKTHLSLNEIIETAAK